MAWGIGLTVAGTLKSILMIQRIQSVWLLVAAVLSFLTLKLSFYSGTRIQDNLYHQLNGTDTILLMTVTIALGILSLLTIFLYKSRVVQLRLCIAAILLDLLLVFLYWRATATFSRGSTPLQPPRTW